MKNSRTVERVYIHTGILKDRKAITLVALVVTIIILLILVGVGIQAITNTGLFNKAKEAKEKVQNAQIEEEAKLADYENSINGTRNNEESKESKSINSVDFDIKTDINDIILKTNIDIKNQNKLLGYHYFVRKAEDNTLVKAGMSTENEININGLDKSTSYNVNVIAYDIENNYKKSSVKETKTLDAPVLTITDISAIGVKDKHPAYMTIKPSELQELLFNGNVNEGGGYVGIMMMPDYPSIIKITVSKRIKLYAYGHTYSDGGGKSGANLIIQKYNETTGKYEDYKTVETKADGNKYELAELEPGKYYMTPAERYVNFDEWEYEVIK